MIYNAEANFGKILNISLKKLTKIINFSESIINLNCSYNKLSKLNNLPKKLQ